jgi:molybdopterin-containing oxidoreductase family membrane subunit
MFVNVGMWLERFVIVVMSLHRDFVPGAWGMYYPTIWDWATFTGTLGFFFTLIFVFIRILPAIANSEMKELAYVKNDAAGHSHHHDPVLEGHRS